ncbi:replication-relaxation family protein [Lysinibacillus sp. NPDC097195]|uniref:replication-relaxation family protein n=1 Tax=Lysinibacillus sp. NPDC097195 TaxID=3364141 RepID=UPI003809A82C
MNTHDYNLSPARIQVLETLYTIRGANARVLTQFMKGKLVCEAKEEKQIINLLQRLKESGLVTSKKLEGKYAGSMYYLSPLGFEVAKRLLNIKPLQKGSMWLRYKYPFNQRSKDQMRDYSYETYKPPVRQYKHHHLILKAIVSLYSSGLNINTYPYRLTLDAVKEYEYHDNRLGWRKYQLKPDAEININNEIYTFEIDRSTESYTQLVQKFIHYKRYTEYALEQQYKFPVTKIIFVVEDKERMYGISRRWVTIMKAFMEGMDVKESYETWPNIQLILTTVGDLANVVENERDKSLGDIGDLVKQKYVPILNNSNLLSNNLESYLPKSKHTHYFLTDNKQQLILFTESNYYNSNFYKDLLEFHQDGRLNFKKLSYNDNPDLVYILLTKDIKHWSIDWNGANFKYDLKVSLDFVVSKVKFIKSDD